MSEGLSFIVHKMSGRRVPLLVLTIFNKNFVGIFQSLLKRFPYLVYFFVNKFFIFTVILVTFRRRELGTG